MQTIRRVTLLSAIFLSTISAQAAAPQQGVPAPERPMTPPPAAQAPAAQPPSIKRQREEAIQERRRVRDNINTPEGYAHQRSLRRAARELFPKQNFPQQ